MIRRFFKSPWAPFIVGIFLLFPRLGERLYWGDEREDFNFIYRILEYGVPNMVDGGHTDGGPQVNEDHLHIYHPWGYLYQNALSVKLFGFSNRFMFRFWGALWALLSIVAVWHLAAEFKQNPSIATWLYTLNPFVLVPARLSRYYGAVLILVPLVILDYIKVQKGNRYAPWRLGLWIALLFHHNTMAALVVSLACVFHWLFISRDKIKQYALSTLIAFGPIAWWLWGMGAIEQSGFLKPQLIFSHGIKTVWLLLASYMSVPILFLAWHYRRNCSVQIKILLAVLVPLFFFVSASSQVTPNMRYLLPIACVSAILVGRLVELSPRRFKVVLFILISLSNVLNLVPLGAVNLLPTDKLTAFGRGSEHAVRFFSVTGSPRFLLFEHLSELIFPYEGVGQTIQSMLIESGYVEGDTVSFTGSEKSQAANYKHVLSEALFDLNDGKPGEMLEDILVENGPSKFIVVFPGEESPDDRSYVKTKEGQNMMGFWIEGPNPFNRRFKTKKTQNFYIFKRLTSSN